MLRASGVLFDVDLFLKDCALKPVRVGRKGERRYPNSKTNEATLLVSSVNFEVSEADFSELKGQFEDAQVWLAAHRDEVTRLVQFPGVEGVTVDFGVEIRPPGWSSFTFPPALTSLVGGLGLHLELSVYPISDEAELDGAPGVQT
jgi:hypothetical protein